MASADGAKWTKDNPECEQSTVLYQCPGTSALVLSVNAPIVSLGYLCSNHSTLKARLALFPQLFYSTTTLRIPLFFFSFFNQNLLTLVSIQ